MAERQKNQLTNAELSLGWDFVAKRLGFAEHEAMFAYKNNEKNLEAQIIKNADPEDPETDGWKLRKNLNVIPRVVEKDKKGKPVYIEAVCNGEAEKAEKRKAKEAKEAEKKAAKEAKKSKGNPADTAISDEERNQPPAKKPPKEKSPFLTDTDAAHPAPNPKVAVYVPDDKWNYPDAPTHVFEAADGASAARRALQEWSWTDTVDGAGSFSFSVENEVFGKDADAALAGKTLFDAIKIRSVVKIYETNDNDKPDFVGIIRDKSVSSSMGSGGVRRRFSFSGDDIMSCVFEYELFPLNVNIGNDSLSKDLTALLENAQKDGWSITETCKAAWQFFKGVGNGGNGKGGKGDGLTEGTTALEKMLEKFAGDDFFRPVGADLTMSYPPVMPLSPTGENPFADILRKLFPPPYYSVFSQTRDGRPAIWFFAAVFMKDNYNKLTSLKIEPSRMTGYNLTRSDRHVSTVFMATVNGMMMTRQQAMAAAEGIERDDKALEIYGQKLCEAAVWGKPTTKEALEANAEMMNTLAKGMKEMFSGEDRFFKGTVTILAETQKGGRNPAACSRISCLGGDFFVRSATHTWRFGGPHLISLSVEKGCVYSDGFEGAKPLEGLGTIKAEAGE